MRYVYTFFIPIIWKLVKLMLLHMTVFESQCDECDTKASCILIFTGNDIWCQMALMVESHAFISVDTISLDSRAARKYKWCLFIYVLSVNLRVPGPLTACTTDIVLMSEGCCKYSRCKRRPVIRSTACNQPAYLSTSNHLRFFNITFSFVILHANNT